MDGFEYHVYFHGLRYHGTFEENQSYGRGVARERRKRSAMAWKFFLLTGGLSVDE